MTHKAMQGGIFALALFLLPCVGAQASIVYTATLTGPAEFPVNASPGTGFATVEYDPAAHTLRVDVLFSGLTGNTTASHIHCCVSPSAVTPTAGVATTTPTFTGFPSGVTSGTYDRTFDLTLASSFNAAFVTANGGTLAGAEAVLANGLADGHAYLNIHTTQFTGGEIRGFLTAVPLPAAAWLFSSGLLGLVGVARHKKTV
jgi:hypothetical protein